MGSREDTQEERENWHWRNSMRPVRFFNLDARAAAPFAVLRAPAPSRFFWPSTIVFVLLERKGLTFDASLRAFRKWLLGQKRPGWAPFRRRKMVDYG